jgi:serine/threonine protein kinase
VVHPGQQFEGYLVENLLGRGGEAEVYRASGAGRPATSGSGAGRPATSGSSTDPAHHVVALKVLDDAHRDPGCTARLAREFRLAARLRHPHIVTVYEHGPFWIAMQYVDGGNATALRTLDDRLQALGQIAAALDHTHRDGIVHNDVKPTNILVHQNFSRDGAVLIDFGVAYVLAEDVWHRPSHLMASLPYAAPELLQGRLPQAATDEYGLACTAVELLTGRTPFIGENSLALVDAHLHLPPPEVSRQFPWLSRAFDMVLARAIAKDPDRRYESCTEMMRHVEDAVRRSGQ